MIWANMPIIYSMRFYLTILIFCLLKLHTVQSWESKDKVLLRNIEVLTLKQGHMTTGLRGKPVPQLQCVGGSAGCSAFVPQVVQCYNRGSDGIDIQWECKTDMDNAYRFGSIEVICEGYDYPNDPYILKGSCGMEYTLDLTKEGMKKHGFSNSYQSSQQDTNYQKHYKSGFGDLVILMIVAVVIYALYKTCLQQRQYSTTDDTPGFGSLYGDSFGAPPPYSSAPPPPGFRQNYYGDSNCSGMGSSPPRNNAGTNNFWTGAATGGLLGYLFGNRFSGNHHGTSNYPYTGRNDNRSWGGTNNTTWGGTSSGTDHSSGTRTASGFGGTRRR